MLWYRFKAPYFVIIFLYIFNYTLLKDRKDLKEIRDYLNFDLILNFEGENICGSF